MPVVLRYHAALIGACDIVDSCCCNSMLHRNFGKILFIMLLFCIDQIVYIVRAVPF